MAAAIHGQRHRRNERDGAARQVRPNSYGWTSPGAAQPMVPSTGNHSRSRKLTWLTRPNRKASPVSSAMPTMIGTVYVVRWNAPTLDESALVAISDLGPAGKTWTLSSLSFDRGKRITAEQHAKNLARREEYRQWLNGLFDGCDAIVSISAPGEAPRPFVETDPCNRPESPYAASKRAAESKRGKSAKSAKRAGSESATAANRSPGTLPARMFRA